ncbi:MAG TPA: prolyl oligopeptidase family serine peptidase [Longimicrobiaceae bacterium]|jgi:dipeptidyl aminopeptidase/acylaminoacyl peptidase
MRRFPSVRACAALALLAAAPAAAQDPAAPAYRTPPAPIPQILAVPPAPTVVLSPGRDRMALLGREEMPGIAALAAPELRLAGERIDPRTGGPSRASLYDAITLGPVGAGGRRAVQLPEGARISSPEWSPDGSHLAFALTTPAGIELWVADAATARARRLTGPELNAAAGSPLQWMPDGRSLLVTRKDPGRGQPPVAAGVPTGPVVQESAGRAAPARTYQDLLATPHDERLFEYHFTSQLARVPLDGGAPVPVGEPAIINSFSVAPGGRYVRVELVRRPFSYLVPMGSFAGETVVLDMSGRRVHRVSERTEASPPPIGRDRVRTGPRSVSWRSDAPATLVWAEAQDEGNPRREARVRDRVLMLDAPFTGEPRTLIELDQRYEGTTWGRGDLALVRSGWQTASRTRTHVVSPDAPGTAARVLWDRSAEDRYADPGTPVTTRNAAGFPVLLFSPDGGRIYLTGEGASARGSYPFLDRMEVAGGRTERLWQARDPHYETLVSVLDREGRRILTRRESLTEPPNYYVRDLARRTAAAATDFPDPAPQLAGVGRQIVTYRRADGVALSATLFTPPGYDARRDGRLPMLMWAYPREFRDAAAAGQLADSPNRFPQLGGASPLFLLTQGYAVLDGPSVPIIGAGGAEPNDTYVDQLVSSLRAAVDKVVEMGVADRDRIGVGGHSYGAFMTANLLAHSDLFRAGIARSGAYNRTLTPFGFQAEPRSFWEASEVYGRMSPFNYADRVDEPILLIHGEMDDNSGTFPVQTERFYAALRGHGATVRYVVLPYEAHGYRARESVLHTLAEMVDWMDRHVKNAPPRGAKTAND